MQDVFNVLNAAQVELIVSWLSMQSIRVYWKSMVEREAGWRAIVDPFNPLILTLFIKYI